MVVCKDCGHYVEHDIVSGADEKSGFNRLRQIAVMRSHKHKEAFCVMQYEDEVTGEVELVWNSRDGVTPFGMRSLAGNMSRHVRFHQDLYLPNLKLICGMRVFVDAREDNPDIQQAAERYVDGLWEKGMREHFVRYVVDLARVMTKEDVVRAYVKTWTKPGEPYLHTYRCGNCARCGMTDPTYGLGVNTQGQSELKPVEDGCTRQGTAPVTVHPSEDVIAEIIDKGVS